MNVPVTKPLPLGVLYSSVLFPRFSAILYNNCISAGSGVMSGASEIFSKMGVVSPEGLVINFFMAQRIMRVILFLENFTNVQDVCSNPDLLTFCILCS